MKITCPLCHREIEAGNASAGAVVVCSYPDCAKQIQVPAPAAKLKPRVAGVQKAGDHRPVQAQAVAMTPRVKNARGGVATTMDEERRQVLLLEHQHPAARPLALKMLKEARGFCIAGFVIPLVSFCIPFGVILILAYWGLAVGSVVRCMSMLKTTEVLTAKEKTCWRRQLIGWFVPLSVYALLLIAIRLVAASFPKR